MRMDTLIQKRRTGTPVEFAKKIKVSQATLYRYLNEMKTEFRAPIDYCPICKSYRYLKNFSLKSKDFLDTLNF